MSGAAAPAARTRLVLAAPFDDATHAHNALRQRALERLGHEVHVLDLSGGGLLGRLKSPASRLRDLLREKRPQAVVVVSGDALPPHDVAALRREGPAAWVHWIPEETRAVDEIAGLAVAYQAACVNGSDLRHEAGGVGMPALELLPPACDPSVHRPLRGGELFRANVVFVGEATDARETVLRELLEFGLAVWGPGWRKTSLRDYCRGELLGAVDFVRAYAGASVAINLHRQRGAGVNARLFELAAIGVPQVVDARADLAHCFVPGEEVVTFGTVGELTAAVAALLQEPAAAEALGRAARRRALAEHTYMHRMAQLLALAGVPAPA